jgi:hypothetical protein
MDKKKSYFAYHTLAFYLITLMNKYSDCDVLKKIQLSWRKVKWNNFPLLIHLYYILPQVLFHI